LGGAILARPARTAVVFNRVGTGSFFAVGAGILGGEQTP
jgi:hypothetical protein